MLSYLDALRDEVAEEVLLQPRLLVDDHELLLAVDVEVVGALAVEQLVFGVEQLVPAAGALVLEAPELALGDGELLLHRVVDDPLDVALAEGHLLAPGHRQQEGAHDVDECLVDLAVEGFLQQDLVPGVGLDQQVDAPKRSAHRQHHVHHLQHLPVERFLLSVVDGDLQLGLEQVLEQDGRAQLVRRLLVLFAVDDQLLLEVVVLVQVEDDVPKGIDLVGFQQVPLKVAQLFRSLLLRALLLRRLLFVLLLGEPIALAPAGYLVEASTVDPPHAPQQHRYANQFYTFSQSSICDFLDAQTCKSVLHRPSRHHHLNCSLQLIGNDPSERVGARDQALADPVVKAGLFGVWVAGEDDGAAVAAELELDSEVPDKEIDMLKGLDVLEMAGDRVLLFFQFGQHHERNVVMLEVLQQFLVVLEVDLDCGPVYGDGLDAHLGVALPCDLLGLRDVRILAHEDEVEAVGCQKFAVFKVVLAVGDQRPGQMTVLVQQLLLGRHWIGPLHRLFGEGESGLADGYNADKHCEIDKGFVVILEVEVQRLD